MPVAMACIHINTCQTLQGAKVWKVTDSCQLLRGRLPPRSGAGRGLHSQALGSILRWSRLKDTLTCSINDRTPRLRDKPPNPSLCLIMPVQLLHSSHAYALSRVRTRTRHNIPLSLRKFFLFLNNGKTNQRGKRKRDG